LHEHGDSDHRCGHVHPILGTGLWCNAGDVRIAFGHDLDERLWRSSEFL